MTGFMASHVDDEMLFCETHYARYGNERTNIYGLAPFESRFLTYLNRPDEFPSHRYESLPSEPSPPKHQGLGRKVRHFMTASAAELTAFVSMDGYWNYVCIPVGLEAGKSEVIAMDVFEEHSDKSRFVVALAVAEKYDTENQETQVSYSLRFYGHQHAPKSFLEQTLFGLGESSQIIPLTYPPMQLSHVQINYEGRQQTAFLMASTDGIMHLYVQDSSRLFVPISAGTYFPLLGRISDHRIKILFLHILTYQGKIAICAGGQNGELFLSFYDNEGVECKSHAIRLFSPITSVLLFHPRVSKHLKEDEPLHLVVTCAIEQAMVYKSVQINGLSRSRVLPQSSLYDSVLCSHVMDVDWDGEQEILIGTYGRQVLIYKQLEGTEDYTVLWRRQFAYPIYRMSHLDLNIDGLDELIVITMYGVHIFQPNMKKARKRLLDVLMYVESSKRQKYELLLDWQRQKELEKAIVFEPQ
ncbi:hypothetical protein J3Q64DRAFT_1707039 [Phycomyces blakesleeanus]|uniref:Kaptin n=1 Tax=Phycomyces blakesleeanus TaxID=4837 RepID=A0ABR3BBQ5_PHYBL